MRKPSPFPPNADKEICPAIRGDRPRVTTVALTTRARLRVLKDASISRKNMCEIRNARFGHAKLASAPAAIRQ